MQEGFFTKRETQSKSRPDGRPYSCASCGLYTDVKTPRMPMYGKGKKEILIIGEAPGEAEDRRGLPWQGPTGRLLQHTLADLGINTFEDCTCINSVNCRTPENRTPKPYEVDCCRITMVNKAIEEVSPKVILLLGGSAVQSIIGSRWKRELGGITKWRGWEIPDQDYQCWLAPTFHPSFVHRQLDSREVMTVWKQDLEKALKLTNAPFPKFKEPHIQYLTDISVLTALRPRITTLSFDYEATGIKPHAKGHRIVCVGITFSEKDTFAFKTPLTRKGLQPFLDLLTDPLIGKMAHNMKYEDTWTEHRFRTEVVNWEWDSMLAAHLMDNRPGVTGLKFQTYVNFGIADYASDVDDWLRSSDNTGNGLNKLPRIMEDENNAKVILKYVAWDSYCQYLLAQKQQKILKYEFLPF